MKKHSAKFLQLVNEAKSRIHEITAEQLQKKLKQGTQLYLIDVREDTEWAETSHIPSAIHVSRGTIERDIEQVIPNVNLPIVVYCSGGFRCALVAESLQKMGYTQVSSLDKGLLGWKEAGYDLEY